MNSICEIILILILAGIVCWLYDWLTLPYKVDTTNALLKEILEKINNLYS